jgi:hypothetical protein
VRDVEIDQTPVDSNAHRDVKTEPRPDLFAECGHFPGNVEAGLYRSSHVVVMGFGVAEYGEQPVTFGGEDVALVAVDGLLDLATIPPDHPVISLRLHSGGQRGGVHYISEKDCQPAHFVPTRRRGSEQVFGVLIGPVERQYLLGQRTGGRAVTAVDRLYCAIKQFVDRARLPHHGHRSTMTSNNSSLLGVGGLRRVSRTWPR